MTMQRMLASVLALLLPVAGTSRGTVEESPADEAHHVYIHLLAPDVAGDVQVTMSDETGDAPAATPVVAAGAEEAVEAEPVTPVCRPASAPDNASAAEADNPKTDMALLFFVFVLAIFLGCELIAKVPSQLHTPLMSGSNAISGITIVGALIAAGQGHAYNGMTTLLGTLAVAFAMINVVGGYLVTDRMLGMFKHKGGKS